MRTRRRIINAALPWMALLLFMLLTKPAAMPVYLLSVPLILLGFAVNSSWRLLAGVCTRFGKDRALTSPREQRAAGIVVSLVAVILLGLQSIGEITPRDILIVIILAAGSYFYFVRNLVRD